MVLSWCTDVDECAKPDACGAHSNGCTNMIGTYECQCESGYVNQDNKCVGKLW